MAAPASTNQTHTPSNRRRWEGIRDGIVRDNCYRHTEEVHEQLALFGFSNSTPLYVGSYWDDVEPARREQVGGSGGE